MVSHERQSSKNLFLPQNHFITINNLSARYWVEGHGEPPVILIHGLGASAEIWMHNIFSFAQRYRTYVPDLVGFGLTEKPDVTYTSSNFTDFMRSFLDAVGVNRAHLVGMSLGGGIALSFSLRYPERVRTLVLSGSAGLGRDISVLMRLAALPLAGEWLPLPRRKGIEYVLKRCVFNPEVITDDLVELYYRYLSLPGAQRVIFSVLRTHCSLFGVRASVIEPILKALHTITQPTLIIWGKQDRIFPFSHATTACEKIPHAKLHILDECGHIPNFEKPEEFNTLVLNFLGDNPP